MKNQILTVRTLSDPPLKCDGDGFVATAGEIVAKEPLRQGLSSLRCKSVSFLGVSRLLVGGGQPSVEGDLERVQGCFPAVGPAVVKPQR